MKYIILKDFTDKHDESIKYKKDEIHEFTPERVEEILSVGELIKKYTKPKKQK